MIRNIQELRHQRERLPVWRESERYALAQKEEERINLIPVDSVRRAVKSHDSAMIDSVLHDHSIEVLGFTVIFMVGGHMEREVVYRPDGTFGTKTSMESDGILGVFMALLKKAVEGGKEILKTLLD